MMVFEVKKILVSPKEGPPSPSREAHLSTLTLTVLPPKPRHLLNSTTFGHLSNRT